MSTPSPYWTPEAPDPTGPYAPSIFAADYEQPAPGSVVIPMMPRSEGGPIVAVKTAMVQALRTAMGGMSLFDEDQKVYIDLDYPMVPAQYPGIWVQFSLTKLNRQGLAQEVQVQGPPDADGYPTWTFVQEWMFEGRVTMTVVGLKSKDRDRLSDALIAMLAFARPPERVLTRTQADTKADRGFITSLDNNPYIAITVSTDTIIVSGEQDALGTPWAADIMSYISTFGFDCIGQFNMGFSHDGLYVLTQITQDITPSVPQQPYEPAFWLDKAPNVPYSGAPYPGGSQNPPNVNYPAL